MASHQPCYRMNFCIEVFDIFYLLTAYYFPNCFILQQTGSDNIGTNSALAAAMNALVAEMQRARHSEQTKLDWILLALVLDKIAAAIFTISALCILSLNH